MIIIARKILPVTGPAIDDGAIVVNGNKIVGLGKQKQIIKKYPKERIVDLEDKLVMPGLVNLHTHLELSCLKNAVGEKKDFFDWIVTLVKEKRKSSKDKSAGAAADALREAIRTGTTCICDISSTEISLPYLKKSGIRACVFLEALGRDEAAAEIIFANLIKRINSLDGMPERIKTGLSPHASYSVSGSLFHKIAALTSSNTLPLSIHLSETKDEMEYFKGRPSRMDDYMKAFGWDSFKKIQGRSPIEAVSSFKMNNIIAVHAVHPAPGDFNLLKKTNASVAWCPRSNHFLGVGKAPVEEYASRGINVGLGTDSLASNLNLNMWGEMRFAWLVSRLNAFDIIKTATINGAKALGLEKVTGSIEPGKDADLIAIETTASGLKDPYQALISETRPQDISFTMVQGKAIYSKDCHTCYEF